MVAPPPSWTPSLRPSLQPSRQPTAATTQAPSAAAAAIGTATGTTIAAEEEGGAPRVSMTVVGIAAGGSAALAAAVLCVLRQRSARKKRRRRPRWHSAPPALAPAGSLDLDAAIEMVPIAMVEAEPGAPEGLPAKAMGAHMGPARAPRARGRAVRALYAYAAKHVDELSFRAGDVLVLDDVASNQHDAGWATGVNASGKAGLVPLNYVDICGGAAAQAEQEADDDDCSIAMAEPVKEGEKTPCWLKEPADDAGGGGGGEGGGGGDDGRGRHMARMRGRRWSASAVVDSSAGAALRRKGAAGRAAEYRPRRVSDSSESTTASDDEDERLFEKIDEEAITSQ